MTIMDKINDMTVAAGGRPSGGSIVDCLENLAKEQGFTGGFPGNAGIAGAVAAALTPLAPEEDAEPVDDTTPDANTTPETDTTPGGG